MRRGRRLSEEELRPFLLDAQTPRGYRFDAAPAPAPLRLAEIFGNEHPVEIEVGFGKGLFLLNASLAQPQINYLGIEIERKYTLFTATRLAKRNRANVKLACCDARWLFRERIGDNCIHAIHVYFPDPWWKTRHRKRRVFNAQFASECCRVLDQGGHLYFATDVLAYFEKTLEMLRGMADLVPLPADEDSALLGAEDYRTNFERKYRQGGRAIHSAVFSKSIGPREADRHERPSAQIT